MGVRAVHGEKRYFHFVIHQHNYRTPTSKRHMYLPIHAYFFQQQLTTKKAEHVAPSFVYNYDVDYELKIDLPMLEYALLHDTLSKEDKDRFYTLISRESSAPVCMVSFSIKWCFIYVLSMYLLWCIIN